MTGHPTKVQSAGMTNFSLSNMAMEMVLRRIKIEGATVHGFRSSFRDWAGNVSSFPREVSRRLKAVEGLSPEFTKFADEKMAEINRAYEAGLAARA